MEGKSVHHRDAESAGKGEGEIGAKHGTRQDTCATNEGKFNGKVKTPTEKRSRKPFATVATTKSKAPSEKGMLVRMCGNGGKKGATGSSVDD